MDVFTVGVRDAKRRASAALITARGWKQRMLVLLKRLTRDTAAQDLAEYAIGLLILSLALIAAVQVAHERLQLMWNSVLSIVGVQQ